MTDVFEAGLVNELRATLDAGFTRLDLARSLERAILDLRGSVAQEALPEMAIRLARHRLLTSRLSNARHPHGS